VRLAADRLALFGAVLVLLAGYLAIFRPCEAAIAERYGQLDDGRVMLDRRVALAARGDALRAERRRLALRLATSGTQADRTAIVGRFVRALARTARADDVSVIGIVADSIPPVIPAGFDAVPIAVSLRGPYRNVIRFVRDLDRSGIAARIGIDALGNADPRVAIAPDLRATLRVTLLRVARPLTGGGHGTR
jgi:hypothetical protein